MPDLHRSLAKLQLAATPEAEPATSDVVRRPATSFDVSVEHCEPDTAVTVQGELDLAAAPVLWDCLQSAFTSETRVICVDLQGVSFIDSSGLNALLKAREMCGRNGVRFAIAAESPAVRRLFEVAGVSALLAGDEAGGAAS